MRLFAKAWPLIVLIALFFFPIGNVFCQDSPPGKYVAFGGGFGEKGFGFGALGIPISEKLASYTLWDFTPVSDIKDASFSLLDNRVMLKVTTTTGIAFNIARLSQKITVWLMGAAGLATTGEYNSVAGKYGAFMDYRVKPKIGLMIAAGGASDSLNGNNIDLRLGANFYLGK